MSLMKLNSSGEWVDIESVKRWVNDEWVDVWPNIMLDQILDSKFHQMNYDRRNYPRSYTSNFWDQSAGTPLNVTYTIAYTSPGATSISQETGTIIAQKTGGSVNIEGANCLEFDFVSYSSTLTGINLFVGIQQKEELETGPRIFKQLFTDGSAYPEPTTFPSHLRVKFAKNPDISLLKEPNNYLTINAAGSHIIENKITYSMSFNIRNIVFRRI